MNLKTLLAAASVAAVSGLAADANAARFYLTAADTLYTADFGGGPVLSAGLGLATGARSPAIAFNSTGQMYAAVTQANGTADLYEVNGVAPNAFAPTVSFVSDLASPTNSFDFMGTGANERLIGTRNAAGSSRYFESTDSTFTAFGDVGPTGVGGGGSFPSTAFNGTDYYAVTGGSMDSTRMIYTIDMSDGSADFTGLSMIFDGVGDRGDAGYGNIQLAGGDFSDGEYYISFYSNALDLAVIGTLSLITGDFTELVTVDVGGSQPQSMGLAITIPNPLAGGMSAAGLLLVGARRRRHG